MPTLKASKQGIVQIEKARKAKGWTIKDSQACREASKILEPDGNWENEDKIFGEIFAVGASLDTWKRFLQGKTIDSQVFQAFCKILDLDYQIICERQYTLVFSGTFKEIRKTQVDAIIEHLKKIVDDSEITLIEISESSIKITVQGSWQGFNRLQELFTTHQLREILDFRLERIELYPVEAVDNRQWSQTIFKYLWQTSQLPSIEAILQLRDNWRNWLDNLIDKNWNTDESMLSLPAVRNSLDSESEDQLIILAKNINLENNIKITVILKIILQSPIEVTLEIYPLDNSYLPTGLQILLVDASENIFYSEEVDDYTDSVKLRLEFEHEERFNLKLILNNITVTEEF